MPSIAWDRREYDEQRYRERKAELTDLLGGRCVQCGNGGDLEFDHVDPATKCFAIMSRWNRRLSYLLPEMQKCQLLCVSCHAAKSLSDSSVDHGGGASGKKNCPCDPCRDRKREYMRDWKARRRNAA